MTADAVILERPKHMLAGVPLLGMLTPKIGLRGLSDSYVLDGSFASEKFRCWIASEEVGVKT